MIIFSFIHFLHFLLNVSIMGVFSQNKKFTISYNTTLLFDKFQYLEKK